MLPLCGADTSSSLGNRSPPISRVVRCFRRWRSRRVEGALQPEEANGNLLTARRTA